MRTLSATFPTNRNAPRLHQSAGRVSPLFLPDRHSYPAVKIAISIKAEMPSSPPSCPRPTTGKLIFREHNGVVRGNVKRHCPRRRLDHPRRLGATAPSTPHPSQENPSRPTALLQCFRNMLTTFDRCVLFPKDNRGPPTLGKFKDRFGFLGELHLVSDKVDYIFASIRPEADYHHNRVVATLNLYRRQNENPALMRGF